MELAFSNICKSVSCSCLLTIPLPEDTMSIITDASGSGIGGVLQVKREGEWEVAAFFSRQTRRPERWYSATELEALALVETVRHFGYYLYGKQFVAFTDHKPLCSLLNSDRLNGRLRRLGMKLQHWMIEVQYLRGLKNGLADAFPGKSGDFLRLSPQTDSSLVPGNVEEHPPQIERTCKRPGGMRSAR